LPRGESNVSQSYVAHNQQERILDAVANLTAAKGYEAVGIDEIATTAAISPNAFYRRFADKEDAFLVTYEVGHAKCLAAVEAAYAACSDWQVAVKAGIGALLRFLASEPAFARIALIDAPIATPRTSERSNAGIRALTQMLVPGLEVQAQRIQGWPVKLDAVAGGLFELCLRYAIEERVRFLPELEPVATYVALAPFIGGEEAAAVAGVDTAASRDGAVASA
jgi:AcrR family transcriptional regulator